MIRSLSAFVLWGLLVGPASAQVANPERERALLVGLCLAAAQERAGLTDLELAMAREIKQACDQAPGPTLYKLKGGRVFEWPTGRARQSPPQPR
jgi:hypothetical protein